MKMKNQLLILLLACTIASCDSFDQVIEIDLPEHTPVLVLNGRVEAGVEWNVFLSKSRTILEKDKFFDFGDGENNPLDDDVVKNATIGVKVDGLDYTVLEHVSDGLYSSSILPPGPGSVLEFEIVAPGFETLKVKDEIPMPVVLMGDVTSGEPNDEDYKVRVSFTFSDSQKDTKDYYALLVKGILGDGTREGLNFRVNGATRFAPEFDEVDSESQFYNVLVFSDDFIDGQDVDVDLDVQSYFSSFVLEVRLAKVSEAFFKYRKTIDLQNDSGDNPFAEPVPIFSNVEGGLGVLSTSSSTLLFSEVVDPIDPESLMGLWQNLEGLFWTNPDGSNSIYVSTAELDLVFFDLQSFSLTMRESSGAWRDGEIIDITTTGTWSIIADTIYS